MNCPQNPQIRHRGSARSAFTLVELLVVMAVIGILVSMLAFAVFPALNRAKEFAIQQEVMQIDASIEQFKIKYGFYPPSWIRILNNDIDSNGTTSPAESVAALLPYINRIAPNHLEAYDNGSGRPIDAWWIDVGQYIRHDQGHDLVFWMSALTTNKQFPLTGDGRLSNFAPAYDNGTFERENAYDFRAGQLNIDPATGVVANYFQPSGKETPLLYIDNSSYEIGPNLAVPERFAGFSNGLFDTNGNLRFENPNTFQLIAYGLDGLAGIDASYNVATEYDQWTAWALTTPDADDNICNFSGGRLDRLKLGSFSTTNTNQ